MFAPGCSCFSIREVRNGQFRLVRHWIASNPFLNHWIASNPFLNHWIGRFSKASQQDVFKWIFLKLVYFAIQLLVDVDCPEM